MTYYDLSPANAYTVGGDIMPVEHQNGLLHLDYTDTVILVLVTFILLASAVIGIYVCVTNKHRKDADKASSWRKASIVKISKVHNDNDIAVPFLLNGIMMYQTILFDDTVNEQLELRFIDDSAEQNDNNHENEYGIFVTESIDHNLSEGDIVNVRAARMKNFLFGSHIECFEISDWIDAA